MPRKKVESHPSTMGYKRTARGHEPSEWRPIIPFGGTPIDHFSELKGLVTGLGVEATMMHVIDLSAIWGQFHNSTPFSERPSAAEIAAASAALGAAIRTIEEALRILKAAADTADASEPERVDQFVDSMAVLAPILAADQLRVYAGMPSETLSQHLQIVALSRLRGMGEAFELISRERAAFAARGPGTKRQVALIRSLRDFFEATTERPAKLSPSTRPDTFHGFLHGFWRIKWPTATGDDTRAALPDLATLRTYLAE